MILIKYSSQFFPWIVTYSVLHFACLSRWMQDVDRVNSVRCGVFMCSCFSCSCRKVTKSATDITSKDGQNRILACKFSPSWRYFAACDDAKRLYLFQCGERWELVSNRYVEFSEVRWQGKNLLAGCQHIVSGQQLRQEASQRASESIVSQRLG